MAKIERFEELQSWQKARKFVSYELATEVKHLVNGMIGYLNKNS
jgi:hypothetical protein